MSVVVAGCGYWGRNLVRNFQILGALSAVCEPSAAGQGTAREMAPGVPLLDEFDDALATDAAAIVIATPAETHFELARRAIVAGKDVFVEKPLALERAEGAELVKLAHDSGRILMVGHVLEYHPAIVQLRDLIHAGEIGDLYYLYSNRVSLGKVRREENILWSFAPHDVAVILRIVGTMPARVSATGEAYLQPSIADVTLTTLEFDRRVRAHILVSWLHPFKEQRLVVIGSKKMITFDDVAKRLELFDRRVELREGEPVPIAGAGEPLSFDRTEPLRIECEAFLRAIETREQPLTDGESAVRVLEVLQAAERSLDLHGESVLMAGERGGIGAVR